MNNIKFGLKLWSINYDLIKESEELISGGFFDYIELMPIPGTQILPFKKNNIPYIIHSTSDMYGFNIADKDKYDFNLDLIKQNIEWADELNAEYIIVHPGFGEMETVQKFLDKMEDKRILIENMPKAEINGEKIVGFTPEQIKELQGNKFGFCLDFGHAIKTALNSGINYKQYVKEFLSLNPKVFHISDGTLISGKDEHLNIGEGDYDFSFFAECIKKSKTRYLTLETPKINLNSLKNDKENILKLKAIL
jgi:deoxyribonuclease-4